MENKLAINPAPSPEQLQGARPPQAVPASPPAPSAEADLRLVIEEQAGTFVYKTIDRRTGEVVLQLPREDVVRMREEETYAAGDVISAQV
jgi:flagellar protein FlaG